MTFIRPAAGITPTLGSKCSREANAGVERP